MSIQLFDDRTDTVKVNDAFQGVSTYLGGQRALFLANAYTVWPLADMLYGAIPVSKAMTQAIWRECFFKIISSLNVAGTYEHYITMLQGIFNVDAEITFTVLGAGSLKISIDVTSGQGLSFTTFTTDQDVDIVTDLLEDLEFVRVLETIDARDLASVLKSTAPAGITVTFEIIS